MKVVSFFAGAGGLDLGVPQDRKRVFFIGYRKVLGIEFKIQNAA